MKKDTRRIAILALLLGGILAFTTLVSAVITPSSIQTPPPKSASSIMLNLTSSSVEVGVTVHANGSLTGSSAIPNALIGLRVELLNGSVPYQKKGSTTTTDGGGGFSMDYAPSVAGTYKLTATFGGNDDYQGSSANVTFFVTNQNQTIRNESFITLTLESKSVEVNETMHADGHLNSTTGIPKAIVSLQVTLSNETVVHPTQGPNATTDGSGNFSMDYVPTKAGRYKFTATFAGNDQYNASSANVTFNATNLITPFKKASSITLTLAASSIEVGNNMHASGSLTGSPGIAGATVSLVVTLPGGDTAYPTQGETTITDSNGAFSADYVPQTEGSYTITASFAGDDQYNSSSAEAKFSAVAQPTPPCPYPWPARIDRFDPISSSVSVTVNQTFTFTAQMWVQNRDSNCNPTPWWYATDTPIVWTLSNGGVQSSFQTQITTSDGTCSASFQFPSEGTWHVNAHWAGNDKYRVADADWDVVVGAPSGSG